MLLEVKCPFSLRVTGNFATKGFYLKRCDNAEDGFELDMKKVQARKYYYQVQLGMAILDVDEAHLFVWTPCVSTTVVVPRQSEELEAVMMDTLSSFHTQYVCPHLDMMRYRRVVRADLLRDLVKDVPSKDACMKEGRKRVCEEVDE